MRSRTAIRFMPSSKALPSTTTARTRSATLRRASKARPKSSPLHRQWPASPETIGYVETHGTGTPLGDPIEIEGLAKVFRSGTAKKNFCAIGSVKSSVGHLDTAAGVTRPIQNSLGLPHKKNPPNLHL